MQVRMGLLNKKDEWSIDRFRGYWREQHSQLASQLPGLKAYHQNHVTDTAQRGISYKRGPENIDGISQLWFDDAKRMNDAFAQALGKKLIADPRVKDLMKDPRVVNGMMRAIQLRGEVQESFEKRVEDIAHSLNLATTQELKDLRRQMKKMERELEKAREAAKKAEAAK